MDKDTILFLVTLIGCGIGIAGFIVGMNSRAKQDGELLAQIKFCVSGIAEIKLDVNMMKNVNTDILTETATQGNRITTLEREIRELKERVYGNGKTTQH